MRLASDRTEARAERTLRLLHLPQRSYAVVRIQLGHEPEAPPAPPAAVAVPGTDLRIARAGAQVSRSLRPEGALEGRPPGQGGGEARV